MSLFVQHADSAHVTNSSVVRSESSLSIKGEMSVINKLLCLQCAVIVNCGKEMAQSHCLKLSSLNTLQIPHTVE